jgi:ADP-ribose pyrophosphatase YjhB (NUDIX family)
MVNNINPKNFTFCPVCGNELKEKFVKEEQHKRMVCAACGFIFYVNPVPAVATILLREKKILLVKRKFAPRKNAWTLPAGFMEYNETAEQAAIRETKEETNLDIKVGEVFAVLPGFDDSRVHVLLIVYNAEIIGGETNPGDDAAEVRFFSLDNVPENIAFSAHRQVLQMLKNNLQ